MCVCVYVCMYVSHCAFAAFFLNFFRQLTIDAILKEALYKTVTKWPLTFYLSNHLRRQKKNKTNKALHSKW